MPNGERGSSSALRITAAGIQCVVYTSGESKDKCDEIVTEFRKPDSHIRGLITVSKATKGFDVPDVGCIIMARPLRRSVAEHIQLLGRGLRLSAETGKTECVVLDHSGNCERFWDDMNDFFETGALELDDGTKKPKSEKKKPKPEDVMVKCPHCAALHKARPFCPGCGHEYPDVSLSAARKKRDDVRENLAAGIDPGEAKRLKKRAVRLAAANSFEVVAHGWMNERKTYVEIGQYEKTLARFKSDVFPWLGSRVRILPHGRRGLRAAAAARAGSQTDHRRVRSCGRPFDRGCPGCFSAGDRGVICTRGH
jgi:superfamily II DNA/RNA helicase